MKKILASLTALGLALGATSGFAQAAEPNQVAQHYYALSADEHILGLLTQDTVSEGSHRYAWIMLFNRTPIVLNGSSFNIGWLLIDTDCAANTSRIVRMELQGQSRITGPTSTDPAEAITEGTAAAEIADVVCRGKTDPVRILDKAGVDKLLESYRGTVTKIN